VRIVRIANFVIDSSGGLRTALHERACGYPWAASVAGFLAAHGVVAAPARR
jgi:hypothetical protein